MPSVTGDIEEKDESLPRIMSMRRKVALGGFAFMFCICAILLVSSPGIVESYTKITTFDEGRKATNDSNIEDIMNKKEFSALTQLDCEVKAELPTGQNKDDGYETIVFDDVFDGEIPWYSTNNQKTIRDGNLFLNLKPNKIGNSCSIYHRCNFVYAGFETRLRISSPLVPMLALGFASNEAEVVFMWFSNESSEFARGLHAYCKIDRIGEFYEPIEIELDISEW
ncbi:MAG: hypothetical protein HXS50_00005, partial [Theionarchaea archaeon]|nr:hypothetical protein [Theionarchaea archaeon]